MISLIVTADKNWAISKDNKPLISIPDDIKYVKDITTDNVIIFGRHTFQNAFNGVVLPDRVTIIVTKDKSFNAKGAIIAATPSQALEAAMAFRKNIFIAGGERISAALLPFCDEVLLTHIDYAYAADAFIPNLDKLPQWVLVNESEEQTHFDVIYHYKRYKKRTDFKI